MKKPRTKEYNFISVVVPFRQGNREEDLFHFLDTISSFLSNHFSNYELIIVNSSESDLSTLTDFQKSVRGDVTQIRLAWQHSLEEVIAAGVELAIGDFIVEFETIEIDYPTHLIFQCYEICLSGFDVVAASPKSLGRYSSSLFYKVLSKVSFRNLELTTESFRIVSRRAVNRVTGETSTLRYRKAMYHYSGLSTTIQKYSPLKKRTRHELSLNEKISLGSNILVGYSNLGTNIAIGLSLFFFLIAIGMGGYSIYSYLFKSDIQSGWTTTILFLSFSFSGVFLVLSILGKYMVILLKETQNKSSFTFKKIEKYNKD